MGMVIFGCVTMTIFFVWEKCEPYPLAADAFDKTRTIALARGIELRVPVGKDSRHPEKPEIR